MAVKLLYYFIFLFLGILVFLLYQEPYFIPKVKSTKEKPNLEAIDITNYSITPDGVKVVARFSKVLRYKNYDKFYDINIVRKKDINVIDNLKAKRGSLRGDNLKIEGKVRYKDSEGVKFSSEEAKYNLKTKVFRSDVDFVLETNSTITHGTSLVYQSKDGKIYANNIKSVTEVNKK